LSYVEFSRFIGLQPSGNRKSVYVRLRIGLPIQAQHYWDGHIARIEKGLLYCGTWENLLRGMAKATVFRRKLLQALMNAQSLEEQAEMWNREWENHTWRLFLKVLCNQFLWTHIIREPGARLIPKMFEVNRYMHDRLHHLANKHLLSKNAFAHLLFYGEYREGCLLPHHLREELFDTIKSRVHTIVPVTNSLINEIKNQSSKEIFTAYSLSDFSSYAEEGIYKSIWDELVRNSETGARFCERQFLVKRSPELLTHHIQRNTALERDLESIDLCAIYTFCAGTISSSES
jgi:S-adenosylmethionine-diacylglycerol 3-amino-3-carboxypropyl transferase